MWRDKTFTSETINIQELCSRLNQSTHLFEYNSHSGWLQKTHTHKWCAAMEHADSQSNRQVNQQNTLSAPHCGLNINYIKYLLNSLVGSHPISLLPF